MSHRDISYMLPFFTAIFPFATFIDCGSILIAMDETIKASCGGPHWVMLIFFFYHNCLKEIFQNMSLIVCAVYNDLNYTK